MGGARREEEKGFGEEGQGREEGEADVSPARIGGVLAGFWKRNRCGVTASCLPILVGPTILLPFKGLRAEGGQSQSLLGVLSGQRVVQGKACSGLPEDSRDSAPPKLWERGQRGYLGAWAREVIHRRGPRSLTSLPLDANGLKRHFRGGSWVLSARHRDSWPTGSHSFREG